MSNKYKDLDIHTYFFDIINIINFDPNKIKIDKKSYKNILIYCIAYVMIKDSKYIEINSVNLLYLIINKVNGYFEEINKNKYLMLVPTNESKEIKNKYEYLWSKIRDLISSITKNSHDYDEKYMKIKFNFGDELPIEICSMIIVVSTVFHENNKYYPQFFLNECLYKLCKI